MTPASPHGAPRYDALARAWQHLFEPRTRHLGAVYFEQSRARIVVSGPNSLSAIVRGRDFYEVEIGWGDEPDEYEFDCTCPAFNATLECKHVWAVVLQMQAQGLVETTGFSLSRPQPMPQVERPLSPSEEWIRRLKQLEPRVERDPWGPLQRPAERIEYRIDVDLARRDGGLHILCVRSLMRKDGNWGAEREYVPRPDGSDAPIDPLDRRIFAALRGASGAQSHYYDAYRYGSHRYLLEGELRAELLPLLCRTERCYWQSGPDSGGPLGWDEGPPWRLELAVERAQDQVALGGELVRGEERLGLDQPLLFFDSELAIIGEQIARIDALGAHALVVALRSARRLELPAEREAELVSLAVELGGSALRSVPDRKWRDVRPTPCLSISSGPAGERSRQFACKVRFDYGGFRVSPEEPQEVLAIEGSDELVRRDLAAETAALARLVECGARRTRADELREQHASIPIKLLSTLVRSLNAEGWLVEADGNVWRSATGSRARVVSSVDWFELEGGLEFGDQLAPFPKLLEAARKGADRIVLGDGSIGMLPERWLERWGLLELAKSAGAEGMRFGRHQGWLLDVFLAERADVSTDADFEAFRARLAAFAGIAPKREPASFQGVLRGYQREGLGWFDFLDAMGFGGCLADDMGLGKTVQVLALLEARRSRRLKPGEERRPSLVVAPRSLVFNWLDEAARFTPGLRTHDHTGQDRRARMKDFERAHLVITTYGTLRHDAFALKDRRFDYLVLDEATAIKNATSQSAKAARLLTADHRLALSGTPIENHIGELWSLFEFLNPGMLGRSRAFQRFLGGGKSEEGPDLSALARSLRPFFLRRTKEEVLDDLPEKTEQSIVVELSRKDRKRYDELREHYRTALLPRAGELGLERMRIQVLEALLRLRQCACHPALIDKSLTAEPSAKLDALLPFLVEIADEGHKALVFSQFTSFLAIVRQRLDELGIRYEYLDGRTRQRKERVEAFQNDPTCPLFLVSLKAGGHGLNLTAADYVFLLDPWWNPAAESQAIDRAHRIGRTRPVFAYRLIAKDTVEEKVLELQQRKRELAATLLGESQGVLRDMTREDLEQLLS